MTELPSAHVNAHIMPAKLLSIAILCTAHTLPHQPNPLLLLRFILALSCVLLAVVPAF